MNIHNKPDTVSDQVLVSLRQIIRSIDLRSKRLVKQFGLTGPQLFILQETSRAVQTTASELARASSLSQATVTGILDRLESRGLISRQRSQRDRRRVHVAMTGPGEDLLESAPPVMQESFIEQFDGLPDWEQHMILSSLRRIVALTEARQKVADPQRAKRLATTGPAHHQSVIPKHQQSTKDPQEK